MPRVTLASGLLVIALVLAGCADEEGSPDQTPTGSGTSSATGTTTPTSSSSNSTTTTSAAPRPMQTFQKDVRDNSFPDGTFTVQKGDKVVWTHRGTNIHSVSTTAGSADTFDSNPSCPPACMLAGQTYEHTFSTAGDVTYHCKIHAGMTGTITVVEALPA